MNEHSDEREQSDNALSADVRAFLARADRSYQVPDPAVKQRVRAAVGVALIAAPLGVAPAALHELGGATKLAARWSLGAKLGAAAVAATLAGAGSWLLPNFYDSSAVRSARSLSAPAASADTAGDSASKVFPSGERALHAKGVDVAPAPLAKGLPPGGATQPAADRAGAHAGDARHTSEAANEGEAEVTGVVDRGELSLLMAASDALDAALAQRGAARFYAADVERGLALLAQHRERFPSSALEQERRGLWLVARCLRDGGPDARLGREASAFLRRFPSAVLTTRIRRACGL